MIHHMRCDIDIASVFFVHLHTHNTKTLYLTYCLEAGLLHLHKRIFDSLLMWPHERSAQQDTGEGHAPQGREHSIIVPLLSLSRPVEIVIQHLTINTKAATYYTLSSFTKRHIVSK